MILTQWSLSETYGLLPNRFGLIKGDCAMRSWSTLQGRPLRRLQHLSRARKDGSHSAPSHRGVGSHRKCG
jgi:hypothetical protein